MKKILLTTTALVGFVAASAMADGPTITLEGGVDFQAGFSDQKKGYKTDHKTEAGAKFAVNSDIMVKAEGKTDYGLTYGGVITLKGDNIHDRTDDSNNTTASAIGDQVYVRQAFVYMESGFGRLEAGSQDSVTLQTEVGPGVFGRGTGGVAGDWFEYINYNQAIFSIAGVAQTPVSASYIKNAHLPFDGRDFAHANKINYFTPKMSGFQAAVGFTPQTNVMGTSKGFNNNHANPENLTGRNVVNASISYANKFDQVGVAANVGGEFGDVVEDRNPESFTPSRRRTDLRAYDLGLALSYAGFTVGANYASWGKSMTLKNTDTDDGKKSNYFTAGVDYENGPVGLSAAWMGGKNLDNKTSLVSIAADYSLAPGFTPYIEANFYKLTPYLNPANTSGWDGVVAQKGNVVIVGTKFNF